MPIVKWKALVLTWKRTNHKKKRQHWLTYTTNCKSMMAKFKRWCTNNLKLFRGKKTKNSKTFRLNELNGFVNLGIIHELWQRRVGIPLSIILCKRDDGLMNATPFADERHCAKKNSCVRQKFQLTGDENGFLLRPGGIGHYYAIRSPKIRRSDEAVEEFIAMNVFIVAEKN